MVIGSKILVDAVGDKDYTSIKKIIDVIPVQYFDDGEHSWYEVVEPLRATFVVVKCLNHADKEQNIVINKDAENLDLILDIFN